MADISRCRRDGGGFRENRSTNGMSWLAAARATDGADHVTYLEGRGQTGRRAGRSDWRDIRVERTRVAREIRLQRRVGCVYGGRPSAARTWTDIEEIAYTSTISVGHLGCRYPAPTPCSYGPGLATPGHRVLSLSVCWRWSGWNRSGRPQDVRRISLSSPPPHTLSSHVPNSHVRNFSCHCRAPTSYIVRHVIAILQRRMSERSTC